MSIVTFGEVMTRFRTPDFKRIAQTMPGSLEVSFAGAEANVAASVTMLGGAATFVTALPDNPIGDACVAFLRGVGIETGSIIRTPDGRIGAYYIEAGANQRASSVVYDRADSAVARAPFDAYDWDTAFAGAMRFHVTGITPALSKEAARTTIAAVKHAKKRGLTVSCDLNFRRKLWCWEKGSDPRTLARRTMEEILPFVDLVIANEADAEDVLGIYAGETDVNSGSLAIDRYPEVARAITTSFPSVHMVAITLRESVSASHNRWGAMLYTAETDEALFAPRRDGRYTAHEITHIVDRVGTGDSFGAGLIVALDDPAYAKDLQGALDFAVAASALCHSIEGDFNIVSRAEVEALAGGDTSGRVRR
ncbi:2-dehydro-3-deoxygluconokinase [Alkalispirochaeta americana]|uniref:2-dehydro-3-deoxygluconokinase n=1 Tax=Alkalispirochaeta americana TaxID=159291 RepID=A0A1N6YA37_9SPIO|nr:sugar kinase [Alkalispirochaeta americana]SIR11447.1 2-dehydro-3-deoxygluconokinase [Alkalispirochaeta americana]